MKTTLPKSILGSTVTDAEFHERAEDNFWLAAAMVAVAVMAALAFFSPS